MTKRKSPRTHIAMLVDRSGSMGSIKVEAQNGINNFIAEQKKNKDKSSFALFQFDHRFEQVQICDDINDAKYFFLNPDGWTALCDSVCETIDRTKAYIKTLNPRSRPDLVILVIVTDGMENKSVKHRMSDMNDAIKASGFQVTFLCNDPTLKAEVVKSGADTQCVDQSMNTISMYAATSSKVTRMRSANLAGEIVLNTYTPDEKNQMGIFCE